MNLNEETMNPVLDMSKEGNDFQLAEYKQKLRALPEVQQLLRTVDIQDPNTILQFGQAPSEGISKTSDMILSTIKKVKSEEASAMLVQLTKIMDQIDLDDLEKPVKSRGVLQRVIKKMQKHIEAMLEKYEDVGKEIDKVHQILKGFENDLRKMNIDLDKQYKANTEFFEALEKYVVAGEMALEQMEEYTSKLEARTDISDSEKQMQLSKLAMLTDMMDQRVMDLRVAENVALQTAPMLQNSQMANFNLMRQINSAFIITLPVFKQAMIQAIQMKRQEVQGKSLEQLNESTNKLLERNAAKNAQQSVAMARMAGGTSIKMDTLRSTYATITQGIEDAKQISKDLAEERKTNTVELENMKVEMKEKGFILG